MGNPIAFDVNPRRAGGRVVATFASQTSDVTYRHSARFADVLAVAAVYAVGEPVGLPTIARATGIQGNRVNVAIAFLDDRGLIERTDRRLRVATSPAIVECATVELAGAC